MGLGDLGNSVFILLVFMFLNLLVALSIGVSTIKSNWDNYKCNPIIMPFSSVFGYDTQENYNSCIEYNQSNFMSSFLTPIFNSLEKFAETGEIFLDTFEDIKLFGLDNQSSITNLFSEVQGKIFNVGNELSKMYIGINDTFSQLGSVVTILFYMVQSGVMTAETIFTKDITGTIIQVIGS